ncbi:hypothetical protein AB0K47_13580 [Streptomyces tirandamycinicus]|uniref:hypothetical protein n=1 Tax=Streptomyces tirandamycinicus TaxID=2174846 RepID=UPI00344AC48E
MSKTWTIDSIAHALPSLNYEACTAHARELVAFQAQSGQLPEGFMDVTEGIRRDALASAG